MPHSSRNITFYLLENSNRTFDLGKSMKPKVISIFMWKWKFLKDFEVCLVYAEIWCFICILFSYVHRQTEYSTRHRIQFGKGHDTKTILLVCLCVDGSFWSALMFATALPEVWFCICAIILGIFWQNLILNHTTYSVRARIWHKKLIWKVLQYEKKKKRFLKNFDVFLAYFYKHFLCLQLNYSYF